MRTLFSLGMVALVGACSSASESNADSVTSDIEDGKVDHGDPAVGLLLVATGGVCTATLVAPNVVLTAAHCLGQGIDKNNDAFYTGTGTPTGDPQPSGPASKAGFTKHAILEGQTFPGYFPDGCPNGVLDIALVHLAKPVTGVAPIAFAHHAGATKNGTSCKTVGFGLHGGSVEQKREAQLSIVNSTSTAILVKRITGTIDEGDSGGPLICNDTIVGTTSCNETEKIGNTPIGAYFARVDEAGSWIQQMISKWH